LERERTTIAAGTSMIFPLPEIAVVDASNLEEEVAKADVTGPALERLLGL
jgi:hypothetical protein